MPHALDSVVPATYAAGLLTVISGSCLYLGQLPRAASITTCAGSLILFSAALAQCQADRRSRRGPPAHPTERHDLHNDEDAAPILDAPSTSLQLLANTLVLTSSICALAVVYGARLWPPLAPLLFLVAAAAAVAATALTLSAEVQRGADVALICRAVREGGGGASWRAVCAAAAVLEAAQRPSALRRAAGQGGAAPVPLSELRRCVSPLIFGALSLNFCGALCLAASAALLLGGASSARASLVVKVAAFCMFLGGVALVLRVGPRRVAAHRRGGRAHIEYDVARALEGWA